MIMRYVPTSPGSAAASPRNGQVLDIGVKSDRSMRCAAALFESVRSASRVSKRNFSSMARDALAAAPLNVSAIYRCRVPRGGHRFRTGDTLARRNGCGDAAGTHRRPGRGPPPAFSPVAGHRNRAEHCGRANNLFSSRLAIPADCLTWAESSRDTGEGLRRAAE